MTRPGFRKGRPGGGRQPAADSDGFLSSSLFSQAQILHLMKNEFARARRHSIPMGVVLLQVDRLARLADFHGGGLRQSVKQAVARLVRDKTRGSDLLGTTNDDCYLLVMPHTDLGQTRVVADRLHQLFGEVEVSVDGTPLVLTASVGITACDDQSTLFFDSLLSQAESALEYAARNGGDQVVSFGETQLRDRGGAGSGRAGRTESLPLGDDDFADLEEDDGSERQSMDEGQDG
jgi:diguanylate cyclase (GGDEF)-like protein